MRTAIIDTSRLLRRPPAFLSLRESRRIFGGPGVGELASPAALAAALRQYKSVTHQLSVQLEEMREVLAAAEGRFTIGCSGMEASSLSAAAGRFFTAPLLGAAPLISASNPSTVLSALWLSPDLTSRTRQPERSTEVQAHISTAWAPNWRK